MWGSVWAIASVLALDKPILLFTVLRSAIIHHVDHQGILEFYLDQEFQ